MSTYGDSRVSNSLRTGGLRVNKAVFNSAIKPVNDMYKCTNM